MLLWPLLAALLTFVVWQPFVRLDFDLWKADDGEYHLLRVYVFEWAVRAGEWLPRWTPDLFVGLGYPIFNFYAPGTYYLGMLLRLFGWDVYTTIQVMGALACCAGAAGAFCLARAAFGGRVPGLVAAVAYAYAPYPFIVNLLIRADLAEALGLALLPWVLFAAWRAGERPGKGRVAALALVMGAMVLTHNLTALVTLPVAAVVGLFAAWRAGRPRGAALGAVLGGLGLALALTAFFWLPALVEQHDVQIHVALDGGHKAATSWLIDPLGATEQTRRGGNPQTVPGPLDLHLSYPYDLNFPPKPSLGQGALFALSAALVLAGAVVALRPARLRPAPPAPSGRRLSPVLATALFCGAGTVGLWLLTTTWSAWAWDNVPLMRFLQFSWRLYGPLALILALFAAGAAAVWRRHLALALLPLLAAALLGANTTTDRPLWLDERVERRVGGPQLVGTENATFGAGTTTGGEFVPRTADLEALGPGKRRGNGVYERLYPEFGWLAGRTRPLDGTLRIAAVSGGPTWTDALVEAETPGVLAFRTLAFPGWRAYLDGHEVPAQLAPYDEALGISPGFLTVPVPAGTHRVQIAFGPTRLRSAAGAVSVFALGALGWWFAGASATGARRRNLRLALALAPAAVFGLACTHDAVRPLLGAPAIPRTQDARLVADLAELARTGGATIESPAGRGLSPFVSVQRLTVEPWEPGQVPRERRWLYMHPPSSLSASILLPERAAFQAGLALDPQTWHLEGADGVRFIVEVTPDGGETVRVFDEHVNPRARAEDRAWLDRWVDLSAFGGRRVTLTLRTDAAQTPDFDWAGWADPAVVVQRDARRRRRGRPSGRARRGPRPGLWG
ncbi:MAG TPA: 6-pyruvoyl-tetrahydropterin synthase-related protein [Chloroflexota bacterium]|nr:6-pyruvoyl-tetrahydropterin synthase-related protein [Chloroflexota bacterium]